MAYEIELYEPIGQSFFYDGIRKDEMRDKIRAVPEDEPILLRIDSPGGSVFDATNILSNLRDHPAGFSARVDGLAASAASLLAVSGDRLEMSEGSWMMIHNPHADGDYDADQHRAIADRLEAMQKQYANAYATKSGKRMQKVAADMKAELWLTDEESVEYGLADAIVDHRANELQLAAYWKNSVYHNMPAALLGRQIVARETPQPKQPSKTELIVQDYESRLAKYSGV